MQKKDFTMNYVEGQQRTYRLNSQIEQKMSIAGGAPQIMEHECQIQQLCLRVDEQKAGHILMIAETLDEKEDGLYQSSYYCLDPKGKVLFTSDDKAGGFKFILPKKAIEKDHSYEFTTQLRPPGPFETLTLPILSTYHGRVVLLRHECHHFSLLCESSIAHLKIPQGGPEIPLRVHFEGQVWLEQNSHQIVRVETKVSFKPESSQEAMVLDLKTESQMELVGVEKVEPSSWLTERYG